MGLQPFSFCELNVMRRHFRHGTQSVDTLMRYLSKLTDQVETKINELPPERFEIIFNGWSGGDAHYIAIFETYPSTKPCVFDSVLLSIAPMVEEDLLAADDHYEFLHFLLSVYDKTMEKVVALIGDNANTNRAFVR